MKNPFSGLFRARDKPQDSVSAAPTFYFGTSGSGKAVNAQTAIQLSTVYACVRVISETVASLPLGVYEAKEDGNRKATEHPLYRLVHDETNSEMTGKWQLHVSGAFPQLTGLPVHNRSCDPSRSVTVPAAGQGQSTHRVGSSLPF